MRHGGMSVLILQLRRGTPCAMTASAPFPAIDTAPPPAGLAVTGAGGRIGRMLRQLWDGGDTAWLSRGGDLRAGFAGRGAVIALAGVTGGSETALGANVETALAALAAAREAGVGRVLLMSSAAVYGRAGGSLDEARAPTPASPYGAAKAAMERAVAEWCAAHPEGPEATILRLGNVAGADALLSRLDGTRPRLDVFADGRGPRRSYIGPRSLAATLARLAAHPGPLPPLLNVAAPRATGMADLLRAAGVDWDDVPAGPEAIAEVRLDTARLQSIAPLPEAAAEAGTLVAEWRALRP